MQLFDDLFSVSHKIPIHLHLYRNELSRILQGWWKKKTVLDTRSVVFLFFLSIVLFDMQALKMNWKLLNLWNLCIFFSLYSQTILCKCICEIQRFTFFINPFTWRDPTSGKQPMILFSWLISFYLESNIAGKIIKETYDCQFKIGYTIL